MKLYIIEPIEFKTIGIVDNALSVVWNNKYYESGDFSLTVALTPLYYKILKKNYYVIRDDIENEICIINQIQISKDENGKTQILATGNFAQYVLSKRVCWNNVLLSGSLDTKLKELITNNAINANISSRSLCSSFEMQAQTGATQTVIANTEPVLKSISGETIVTRRKIASGDNLIAETSADINYTTNFDINIVKNGTTKTVSTFYTMMKNPVTSAIDTIEQSGNAYVMKRRNFFRSNVLVWLRNYLLTAVNKANKSFKLWEKVKMETLNDTLAVYKIPVSGILASEPFMTEIFTKASLSTDDTEECIYCEDGYLCIALKSYAVVKNYQNVDVVYQPKRGDNWAIRDSGTTIASFDIDTVTTDNIISVKKIVYKDFNMECPNFINLLTRLGFTLYIKQYISNRQYYTPFTASRPSTEQIKGILIAEQKVTQTNISLSQETFTKESTGATTIKAVVHYAIPVETESIALIKMVVNYFSRLPQVSYLSLGTTTPPLTSEVYEVIKGNNLLEYVEKKLMLEQYGIKSIYNATNKTIQLIFYKGIDRTKSQTENKQILFSESVDNIKSFTINTTAEKPTSALCYGKDNDNTDVWVDTGSGTGLERKEIFVDVSDMSDVGTADYTTALEETGEINLNGLSTAIDVDVNNLTYKYRQDYNVGDLVTVLIQEYNIKYDVRILEVLETFDNNGYQISIILGE